MARTPARGYKDLRFPPELIDQVIQNIDSADTRTLCNLGLVSRTWLALSRAVLFSSVTVTLKHEKLLSNLTYSTFRPYVREITLGVATGDSWTQDRLPRILTQLPAFNSLRLLDVHPDDVALLPYIFPTIEGLTLALRYPPAGDFGLPTTLRVACAFPLLQRLKITTDTEYNLTGPFNLPDRDMLSPLTHLRTVHLDYPMLNARVLEYLAAPALDTLHLTLRSDSDSLHACLRAAGPTLRALVLSFPSDPPRDMRVGRLMTPPLPTDLRVMHLRAAVSYRALFEIAAHLIERVLSVRNLERLVIEMEEGDADIPVAADDAERMKQTRDALSRVLETISGFKTLRIYPPYP